MNAEEDENNGECISREGRGFIWRNFWLHQVYGVKGACDVNFDNNPIKKCRNYVKSPYYPATILLLISQLNAFNGSYFRTRLCLARMLNNRYSDNMLKCKSEVGTDTRVATRYPAICMSPNAVFDGRVGSWYRSRVTQFMLVHAQFAL